MKKYHLNKLEQSCANEAIQKCFDELYIKPYKSKYSHIKSRKIKEARRHIIKYALAHGNEKQIKLIVDDYYYWIARNTHKLLKPTTPDNYYV